jgi:DNA-binding NarL/FixJ family response regulator
MLEDILTPNEYQIAMLVAEGYDYREIGARVGMGSQSVKNLLSRMYKKLELDQPGRRRSILLTRMVITEQNREGD